MNTIHFSIIVPVYREAEGLEKLLEELEHFLSPLNYKYEIILIDDGSDDNTWDVIQKQLPKKYILRGLRLSRNFGKEAALCAGIENAQGQAIITMDGDLQHPPKLIPQMISLWEQEVFIVEAVKSKDNGFASKMFYRFFKQLSGFELSGASDFKLIDRKVLDVYLQMKERNLFFRGMMAWVGFKRETIVFDVPERTKGESQWGFFKLIDLATVAFTSFSSKPLRIINFLGGFLFVIAFFLVIRSLWVYFSNGAAPGITTVIILQLFIGSCVMFGLGIIGEYIARIFDEVKARPRYIIAESENKSLDTLHNFAD